MRYFSIEEADKMVPFLQQTFESIRDRASELVRLNRLLRQQGDRSKPFTPVPNEIAEGHRQLRLDRDRHVQEIQEAFDTLSVVGIHVKRGDGKVDFPSKRGERRVLLCWEFGEPAVTHWHEFHGADSDRLPIRSPDDFGPHYLN